ncbi:MAG: prepilin-type N-terminal cleavage/methylation domain-containing protein [Kiritimatiellae bacterium]|nr:prepilin-type N-terminal cleavage/methylation domain-containing protein [Kiritimatiellia bacterium]
MKKFAKKIRMRRGAAAFTLVEMMVVVVVIAILIAGVFRLMKAVDMKNREAQTKARLQRIQNAISAFYAEYGTYPPVAYYGVPDPYVEQGDPYQDYSAPISVTELTAENAVRAARCQPAEYLYPTPRKWDAGINRMFQKDKAVSVNDALAGTVQNHPDTRWDSSTGIRAFRFGLLSFLLPRFTLMGGKDDGTLDGNNSPDPSFTSSRQWREHNPGTLKEISEREQLVTARWLPNFENLPLEGVGTVMGVQTGGGTEGMMHFQIVRNPSTGQDHVLLRGRAYDGWYRDFFYHSAPPYQSYRIWSAGEDGVTFPPWATPRNSADRKKAESWTKDDIVLFDR